MQPKLMPRVQGLIAFAMTKTTLLTSFMLLSGLCASAQHAITSNRVSFHIGENVVVIDTVSRVTFVNDSTSIISLGKGAGKTANLKLILHLRKGSQLNREFLSTLSNTTMEVNGKLMLNDNQPSVLVTNEDKLYFFSAITKQRWAVLSQVNDRTRQ